MRGQEGGRERGREKGGRKGGRNARRTLHQNTSGARGNVFIPVQ
jgi:hypothetical protein